MPKHMESCVEQQGQAEDGTDGRRLRASTSASKMKSKRKGMRDKGQHATERIGERSGGKPNTTEGSKGELPSHTQGMSPSMFDSFCTPLSLLFSCPSSLRAGPRAPCDLCPSYLCSKRVKWPRRRGGKHRRMMSPIARARASTALPNSPSVSQERHSTCHVCQLKSETNNARLHQSRAGYDTSQATLSKSRKGRHHATRALF